MVVCWYIWPHLGSWTASQNPSKQYNLHVFLFCRSLWIKRHLLINLNQSNLSSVNQLGGPTNLICFCSSDVHKTSLTTEDVRRFMQLVQLLQTDNVIIVSASYILLSINYQYYELCNHEKVSSRCMSVPRCTIKMWMTFFLVPGHWNDRYEDLDGWKSHILFPLMTLSPKASDRSLQTFGLIPSCLLRVSPPGTPSNHIKSQTPSGAVPSNHTDCFGKSWPSLKLTVQLLEVSHKGKEEVEGWMGEGD